MSDNLNPDINPKEIKVKRLNRIPLLIVLGLLVATMGAILYIISNSANRNKNNKFEKNIAAYHPDEQTAQNLLKGKQKYGVIEIDKKTPEPIQTLRETKTTPLPATQKTEMSSQEKELEKIRKAKLKLFEKALSSPVSVGRGLGKIGDSKNNFTTAGSATKGDFLSKMLSSQGSMLKNLTNKTEDPNKQQHKADYYIQEQPATEYLHHTRNKQRSPYEIKTGTVIPATMFGGLNSDLPGMILAQVSQNVYDTATGDYLLIPQGARLVGTYDNFIAYGQDRALVKWSRIVYPDGSTLELEGTPGTDQSGYAGFTDQVDHHYYRIFGSAILMSIITGAYDYSQQQGTYGTSEYTAGDALSSSVARELSQASAALLRKNLNVQPTIKIRPGYKFLVMVKKDMLFPEVW